MSWNITTTTTALFCYGKEIEELIEKYLSIVWISKKQCDSMSFEEGRYIMENKILDTLFEYCDISEEYFKKDDVQQQQKKLEELISELNDGLSDENKERLQLILDAQCDLDLMQCQEYFKQGVRIGVQFLNELKEVSQ